MTRFARITGTGRYLPEHVMTNHDLEALVETSDEWIRERTGIVKRHIAAEGETTCDLAEEAARLALEAAGRKTSDVDLIVVDDDRRGIELLTDGRLADVAPMVLQLLGLPQPDEMTGRSLISPA